MPADPDLVTCPACGTEVLSIAGSCVYCGAPLQSPAWPSFRPAPNPEPARAPEPLSEPIAEPAPAPAYEHGGDLGARKRPLVDPTRRTRCPTCGSLLASGQCRSCGWGKSPRNAVREMAIRIVLLATLVACLCGAVAILVIRQRRRAEEDRVLQAGGHADDPRVLEEAFAALRRNSYARLAAVSVTPADFIVAKATDPAALVQKGALAVDPNVAQPDMDLADPGAEKTGGPPKLTSMAPAKRMGYAAEVLLPEQRKQQQASFGKAVAGGDGQIDFRASRFLGTGTLVAHETITLPDDQRLPVRLYSVRIETPAGEVDSRDLLPLFLVADFRDAPKLLDLRFAPVDAP